MQWISIVRIGGTACRVGLALLLCLQSGCVVLGRRQEENRLEPAAVAQIQKGMTREQVTDILGAPQEIIFSNKEHDPVREHAYVYEHQTSHYTGISLALVNFGNMSQKKDRMIVFFDESDRVDHVGASLHAKDSGFQFPFGR